MGTAGSLKYLGDSINCPFLVFNGDLLTRLNYKNLHYFHKEHSSKATICVKKNIELIYSNKGFPFRHIN